MVAEAIVLAGALSCVLVWLEIKPRDLMNPGPHWWWLVAAVLLFCVGVGSSIWSLYLATCRVNSINSSHLKQLSEIRRSEHQKYEQWKDQEAAQWRTAAAGEFGTLKQQHQCDSDEIEKLKLQLAVKLASLSEHSAKPEATTPLSTSAPARGDKSPIVFNDPVQGINPENEEAANYSWWHVPVTANEELRYCNVQLQLDTNRNFEMLWSVGHGDKPAIRVDLAPNDTINIPIAARCEHDGLLTGTRIC